MKKIVHEPMRLFIAIELNDALREEAMRISEEWFPFCPQGNFSKKENLHITLRFLGMCDPGQVEKITSAMGWAAALTQNFSLRLGKPGSFSKGNESVLWLGLTGDLAILQNLHSEAEIALKNIGFAPEGVYRPHLTLARAIKNADIQAMCAQVAPKPVGMIVNHLTLMHSTRVDGELTYVPLAKAPFGG